VSDKHTYPTRRFTPEQNIRIVTGGSAVRAGAYLAPGVVVVPHRIRHTRLLHHEGTMVDSHALVGLLRPDRQTRPSVRAGADRWCVRAINASLFIIEDTLSSAATPESTKAQSSARAPSSPLESFSPAHSRSTISPTTPSSKHRRHAASSSPPARSLSPAPCHHHEPASSSLSVYTPIIVNTATRRPTSPLPSEDLLR